MFTVSRCVSDYKTNIYSTDKCTFFLFKAIGLDKRIHWLKSKLSSLYLSITRRNTNLAAHKIFIPSMEVAETQQVSYREGEKKNKRNKLGALGIFSARLTRKKCRHNQIQRTSNFVFHIL